MMTLAERRKFSVVWRQIEFKTDLYKFYFEVFLKFNLFYYAITSGSIAYAVSNPDQHYSRYILFIPIIIGFFFLIILFYGSILIKKLGTDMQKMTAEINVGSAPNTIVLVMFFYLAALIYVLISIGIVVLLL